jgi:hypothetical protein
MHYTKKQDEVRNRHGINETVATLLDYWAGLIEECSTGYRALLQAGISLPGKKAWWHRKVAHVVAASYPMISTP